MIMKCENIFLISLLFLAGCQKPDEEERIDLDRMVRVQEDRDAHIAGEPLDTPEEQLIQER